VFLLLFDTNKRVLQISNTRTCNVNEADLFVITFDT